MNAPGDVDQGADVFSLGVLLYEMVCGRPPFVGEGLLQVIQPAATGHEALAFAPDGPVRSLGIVALCGR